MTIICIKIKSNVDLEYAWHELEAWGLPLLYSTEDPDGVKEIYADLPPHYHLESISKQFEWIQSIHLAPLPDIDWTAQWASHGLDYHDGYVHVDLRSYGCERTIRLEPGPGFGDLSHPTTRLVLELMATKVKGQSVIDIGCGSGVLALCAVAMGAKTVHAIDIDTAAIAHAQVNAKLNDMEHQVLFELPHPIPDEKWVILMNMIRSEQEVAWQSLKQIHQISGICLTSGIMMNEREEYLQQTRKWNWKLISEVESEGWLGFHFDCK
jgi:ribosomal protein L11 methyltransferase